MRSGDPAHNLIIGAGGLIGAQVASVLGQDGRTWNGTYHRRPVSGLLGLDVTNPDDVERVFSLCQPRVVFHCANLSGGVDFCETHPERAAEFHLRATQTIGAQCQRLNARLVFLSSDYVFDGRHAPYREEDPVNPLNVYGALKLQAEQWIQRHLTRYLIIRTTNVYGWDPETVTPNYLMVLYRALREGKRFRAPSFLWGQPTYARDLAAALVELATKQANGVFHVVGPSFINRFDWAREACAAFGVDPSLIDEAAVPPATAVPRPLKSRLKTEKFTGTYETTLLDVREGLARMAADLGRATVPP